MMDWISKNLFEIFALVFGTGGIGYALITRALNRRKYEQEIRDAEFSADLKSDEFWKARYDVLEKEVQNKDNWWKSRYDTLYVEYENERRLGNEIVKSFRTELNEMRNDYEKQRDLEKEKYNVLIEQYRNFELESQRREDEYKLRIKALEELVESYEKRLGK